MSIEAKYLNPCAYNCQLCDAPTATGVHICGATTCLSICVDCATTIGQVANTRAPRYEPNELEAAMVADIIARRTGRANG